MFELPIGAIENGREFLRRLTDHYRFECEGGWLENCVEYQEAIRCFEVVVEWSRQAEQKIKTLKERERLLDCLEAAGVDNWEGIDFALELFEND